MWNIKHHRLAVTEWRLGGLFAIVPRSGSSSCRSHCTASQQCCCPRGNPCPRGSSRTNFQVLVLVLVWTSSPCPCPRPWVSTLNSLTTTLIHGIRGKVVRLLCICLASYQGNFQLRRLEHLHNSTWMVPPCAEWWCEMDSHITTPFIYCPSTTFLPVQPLAWMPDETDAKMILTALP